MILSNEDRNSQFLRRVAKKIKHHKVAKRLLEIADELEWHEGYMEDILKNGRGRSDLESLG